MSATMINRSELERIKASILPSIEDNSRIERRKELKKKSEDRLKNWPNTLEALRLKKESFLKDREAEEEAKRQEIDREVCVKYSSWLPRGFNCAVNLQEAEIRRKARLEAIRKANDLIYAQTDKMKLLKSQKLYADVIATRFEQADFKHKVHQHDKEIDADYHQKTLQEVARLKAAEEEKVAKTKKLVDEIKAQRVEQLEEARKRRADILEAERQNGIDMKEKAVASLEAEMRDLEEKKRAAAANNLRMLKANSDLKGIRQQIIEEERRQEAERDAQVESIEGRKLALKRLEKERFAKSQLARQRMIDAAVEQLAKQSSAADAALEKQVQDLKDKEDRLFHEKLDRQRREYEETVASRTAQVEAKRIAQERDRAEEARLLEKWRKENEDGIQREKDKVARAKDATIACKATQKADGEAVRRKREEDRQREIEQTRFLQSIDVSDESRFVELCQAEIERNIKLGRPVYTLLRALEYSAPPLLPAKTVPVDRQNVKGNKN
jgi:hypothetical protein